MAIKQCDCKHDFQDKTYGDKQRVHNWAAGENNKAGGWRCTVCKKLKVNNK